MLLTSALAKHPVAFFAKVGNVAVHTIGGSVNEQFRIFLSQRMDRAARSAERAAKAEVPP